MKLILISSMSFISSLHPISMIMIMMLTTMYMSIIMYMIMKSSWLPLIIMLLMLGGLLVLFLYITSLTPNKKFIFKKLPLFMTIFLLPFLKMENKLISNKFNLDMTNLFNMETMTMMIFTLIYLLISLIAIMLIIKSSMTPLKSN
uniref:NADH dehydrogenase subunit 6 n=1 Tax=Ornithodoros rostratus TaxID=360320 RepID=W0FDM7_ORNRO|nr:NADH dehydrogenase subunit 6 [Ornithodoros rostratus]AHF21675.1 NADH dehydrogenase subunit 6 [Ornithodoros rostratus]